MCRLLLDEGDTSAYSEGSHDGNNGFISAVIVLFKNAGNAPQLKQKVVNITHLRYLLVNIYSVDRIFYYEVRNRRVNLLRA